ncbi:hypothetical protein [Embleya sp. NPDC059259]|uniref:hypothetical protein n=2 Tax=unclassified Embleya TaxID=2699296 RepID=UPI0036ABE2A3
MSRLTQSGMDPRLPGGRVRMIDATRHPGQPAGDVIALDDFAPGRAVSVQPPDGGLFRARRIHEVEHAPPHHWAFSLHRKGTPHPTHPFA